MGQTKNRKILYLVLWNIALIILLILIQSKIYGQYRNPPNFFTKLAKNWSVNANGGRTSFFGDVSLYDEEFNEKMSREGAWATGFGISRQFTPIFGLSGQIVFGQLEGSNSKSHFISDIREYTLNVTMNFVNLLIPENDARFNPYVIFGMGQFTFSTTLYYNDPNIANIFAETKEPEFVYLFGGGAFYKISDSFSANLEFAGRRMENDRIDGSTANKKDNDYYSYFSVGINYYINNVPRDTRYYKRLGMRSPLIRRRK